MSQWSNLNYEEFKHRYLSEPAHLTAQGRKPSNVFEERENAAKLKNRIDGDELDALMDRAYKRFGIESDELKDTVYSILFFKRFNFWPAAGQWPTTLSRSTVNTDSLPRFHETMVRMLYPGDDQRILTIRDYSGVDSNGQPERFSAFVRRIRDNGYRSLKDKERRDKEVGFVEDSDDPLEKGFISESTVFSSAAVPPDGELDNNEIPGRLAGQLDMWNFHFRQAHPAVAHAVLDLNI